MQGKHLVYALTAIQVTAALLVFLLAAPSSTFADCSGCSYGEGCYSVGACVETACDEPQVCMSTGEFEVCGSCG